jgi:histone-lysine N-methyltransferase SUV39H
MEVRTGQISCLHYYSSAQGLFAIDVIPGLMVIECNKVRKSSPLCISNIQSQCCRCDISCPNRVSQRPRQLPIDIFKTTDRGWGARPLCDVRKGTVLGMYTGYGHYFN